MIEDEKSLERKKIIENAKNISQDELNKLQLPPILNDEQARKFMNLHTEPTYYDDYQLIRFGSEEDPELFGRWAVQIKMSGKWYFVLEPYKPGSAIPTFTTRESAIDFMNFCHGEQQRKLKAFGVAPNRRQRKEAERANRYKNSKKN